MKMGSKFSFLFVNAVLVVASINKGVNCMNVSSSNANLEDYTQFLLANGVARTPPMGYYCVQNSTSHEKEVIFFWAVEKRKCHYNQSLIELLVLFSVQME